MRNKAGNFKLPAFSLLYGMLLARQTAFYICAAALIMWVLVCYNPFALWFQNDDFSHILLSKHGVFFQKNSFRPICDLSVMVDYFVWGKYAPGYHITNLFLHVICTVLVYFLSKQLFLLHCPYLQKPFFAVAAALLFFAYPFHGEAVFWVLGRSGILGAIFSLLFLLFFVKEKVTLFYTVASLVAWGAALLTYESCWVLPLVAAILAKPRMQKTLLQKLGRYWGLAILFVGYLAARVVANGGVMGSYEGANFLQFNAGVLTGNFFKLAIMGFVAYTDSPWALQAGFFVAFGVLVFLFCRCFSTWVFKLVSCFLILLLPYLSLGIDTHGTEGERFLYLPSVFAVLCTVGLLGRLKKRYMLYGSVGFMAVLYAVQLYIAAVNYRFAGKLVQQTLIAMACAPVGRNITMEGLPKSQHGALIFASGLRDGQLFYATDPEKIDLVKIKSWRYELNPLQAPYKTVMLHAQPGMATVRFVFTDTALLIYR